MRQELVRINSIDGLEEVGILYTPNNKTEKIVVHVHGLNGNFYENRFLDVLSKAYTDKNYAFLTFNNRGKDYITEMNKGNDIAIIGGCLERFKDCLLDIEGVINWVKEKGYKEIILEGHSYGCNKVLYYYSKKKDQSIKKIVLLAPCDIPETVKKYLTQEEYDTAKLESTRLVKENKEDALIDYAIMINNKISAGTFYYDFLPGGDNDFIRYKDEEKNEVLSSIDIPTLIIFGDADGFVLSESIEKVENYFNANITHANVQIIHNATHSYINHFEELKNIVENYI